jgi:hypothetical protein
LVFFRTRIRSFDRYRRPSETDEPNGPERPEALEIQEARRLGDPNPRSSGGSEARRPEPLELLEARRLGDPKPRSSGGPEARRAADGTTVVPSHPPRLAPPACRVGQDSSPRV